MIFLDSSYIKGLVLKHDGYNHLSKKIKPHFELAFALFPYKGDFKEAIRGAKFYDEYHRIRKISRRLLLWIKTN